MNQLLNLNPALLVLIAVWTLIWKGLALWHASHREQKLWFGILLFVNTLGILELVYLTFVAKIFTKK